MDTTPAPPQEPTPEPSAEADVTPAFALSFAGVDPNELGEPIGVQDLHSRLAGFEQHMLGQFAELNRRLDELEQELTAKLASMRHGVQRAVGVDPLGG